MYMNTCIHLFLGKSLLGLFYFYIHMSCTSEILPTIWPTFSTPSLHLSSLPSLYFLSICLLSLFPFHFVSGQKMNKLLSNCYLIAPNFSHFHDLIPTVNACEEQRRGPHWIMYLYIAMCYWYANDSRVCVSFFYPSGSCMEGIPHTH